MGTFYYQSKIGLHHTDAAGILFYSHIFTLAYDAFDAWLEHIGVGVAWIINESDFLFPYVHAEADYLKAMTVGHNVTIVLTIENVGASSLTLNYDFLVDEEMAARAKTVHVAIHKKTKEKIELPPALVTGIEKFLNS